ncbi:MAG: UDP-N-acetylglucosamine--N-acetylmuramyl-(pentapeptide) pyrophosphoryl-undecaprenol N-acetylglucosamine transferase [bacterium]|nr:MAG: UDP-N-acetylglucosamine--N-acetylmuramyl-(pentapeptide) pyrophosphoryl-undecaprenol N-acetylglucosamine transferase [bacterium]
MEKKTILLAGSHAGSTAIAIVEEIKKRNLDWELHWIGKRFSKEGSLSETLEYKNLSKYDVKFHNLESGKLQTKFTRHTIPALLKVPAGFLATRKLIKAINPDLTLSFGSAAGAMTVFWSNFYKISTIIHEQTATAGRANIISSYFSKKILVSRESSYPFFNKNKTMLVGNPINSEIATKANLIDSHKDARSTRVKSILITGGSRGSTWINEAIKPLLPQLTDKYYVLHQTGDDNLDEFKSITNNRYLAFGQVGPNEMAEVLLKADVAISRAGANTVSELTALKIPSILIPIPWTYNDEQTENAKYMEKLGLARILLQKDLNPQKLLSEIEKLIADYRHILTLTENLKSPDLNAASDIVDILEESI